MNLPRLQNYHWQWMSVLQSLDPCHLAFGSGEASHEWLPVYAVCEWPTPEWSGMSNEDKLEHLGEIAARDAEIKARNVLRYN